MGSMVSISKGAVADGFHGALAAGALERIATPDLEDQIAPEGAHVAAAWIEFTLGRDCQIQGCTFRYRSLIWSKDFQIAVIGVETAVSASGDFLDHPDLCQLGK